MSSVTDDLFFEYTFTFSQSIDRIWAIIKDISLLQMLNHDKKFPIQLVGDCLNVGQNQEFEGMIQKKLHFKGKCLKIKSLPHIKKHVNLLTLPNSKEIIFKLTLYKIVSKDSCLAMWQFKFSDIETKNYVELEKNIKGWKNLMEKIDKVLSETSLNLFQFEGCVISAQMNDIWNILTDTKKLKNIAPLLPFQNDKNFSEMKKGQIYKLKYNNNQGFYHVKLNYYNNNPKSNKWVLAFEASDGFPKIPFQKVVISLTKINNEDCQLSIFHEFKEPAKHELIMKLGKEKRYMMNSLKDYLENFNFQNSNQTL